MDFQKTKNIETNSFSSGMNKDLDPQLVKDGLYGHAINSALYSKRTRYKSMYRYTLHLQWKYPPKRQ
jgi:hypothetical protein